MRDHSACLREAEGLLAAAMAAPEGERASLVAQAARALHELVEALEALAAGRPTRAGRRGA